MCLGEEATGIPLNFERPGKASISMLGCFSEDAYQRIKWPVVREIQLANERVRGLQANKGGGKAACVPYLLLSFLILQGYFMLPLLV